MPVKATPRFLFILLAFSTLFGIIFVTSFRNARGPDQPVRHKGNALGLGSTVSQGYSIAPKLGNETAKAELGRATWKYFHTVMARFPDKPTQEEKKALTDYIWLFQRLYPCGECADHFGEILKKYPPQVSSRSNAAVWACYVHNEVNESLGKPVFDCANIGDFYDCGCADDTKKAVAATKSAARDDAQHDPTSNV